MKTSALLFLSSLLATAKPNIVFILADDLGINDLSGEGSTFYETPHIDRIGREGMRFTNGYSTCQVCSPSRASIMSGQYPARIGITDWIGAKTGKDWDRNDKLLPPDYQHHLPHKTTTMAEALKAGGYRTFFAGKWHLGGEGSQPEHHGFDINKGGFHAGGPRGGYFSPYRNPELADGPKGESLPIRLAHETAAFIKEHPDTPFFAFLSFYSVHSPLQTSPALWKKYRDKAALTPHVGDRFIIDRTMPVRQVQDCPLYAGMIESMDTAVGIVLKSLDDLGLAENTIIIFTSDNGGVSSGDAFATSCLPLRGGKGRQWEGGIRQPYYLKVPGLTRQGSISHHLATGTDFFPTLLELAGLKQLPQSHLDGQSLVPALKGKHQERVLFWHYPHYGNQGGEPSGIVRKGNFKLIHYYEDGRNELYHLKDDVGEQHDLSSKMPERVQSLHKLLSAHLKEIGAQFPKRNQEFDTLKKQATLKQLHTTRKARLEKQHANFLKPDFKPNPTWWGSAITKD